MQKRQYFNVYFNVHKFSNFDGSTCVSYEKEGGDGQFKMTATPLCIRFENKIEICSEEDLRDFARLIADVWRDHEKLSPKIITGNGH